MRPEGDPHVVELLVFCVCALQTIREKLKTRGYGKDDFHRCVWLVLNNAKQFFKTDEMRKAGKAALAEV
jgi:hypothetical protein